MVDKRIEVQGGASAQLVQLMRRTGGVKGVTLETATITSSYPNLKLKLDVDGTELFKDDVMLMDSMVARTRKVTIDGIESTIKYGNELLSGDVVLVANMNDNSRYIVLDKVVR